MADEEDVNIGGKPISSLRVVDLKKECDKRGLSKSGSKSQLVDRLKTQLLLENLGKDKNAPSHKFEEEECQNEFIKQYLAQQKQLIEHLNSSSQESDADESPKKSKSVDQSPPIRSPPVEISPEKPAKEPAPVLEGKQGPDSQAENSEAVKEAVLEGDREPVKQESKKPTAEGEKEPVSQEDKEQDPQINKKPATEEKTELAGSEKDKGIAECRKDKEPVESKSEGAIEDTDAMGRSKRKISRLDSGSKSQGDISDVKPVDRRSRRSRNSGSAGDECNIPVEGSKEVSGKVETESTAVASTVEGSEDKENREKMEVDIAGSGKQENGETRKEQKGEEKIKVNEKEDRNVRGRSSSRSRSRTPSPSQKRKQPLQVSSSTKHRARSSSSSSSSSSSRSRSPKVTKKGRSSSGSSSSSRSRSRTPEKKKKTILRKKTGKAERSGSSSRSRSRSPSAKRVKKQPTVSSQEDTQKQKSPKKNTDEVKKRSPSRSSSSRSRSRSPVNTKEEKVVSEKADIKETQQEPMETTQSSARDSEDKINPEPSKDGTQRSEVKVTKKISLNRKTIEDAGKTPEETGDMEKGEGGDKLSEEKPAKKRKWGSRSTSTSQKTKKASSIPISTESLKNLIPDIKPSLKLAPEPVLEDEMDYEDDTTTTEQMVTDQEDTRSVKIQRTVTQDVKKERESGESESEGEADKEETEGKQKSESADDNESGDDDSDDNDDKDEEEKKDVKVEIKEETAMEEGPAEEGVESKPKEEAPVKQTKTITVTTKVKKEKRDKNKEIKLVRRLDSGGSALVKPDEPIKARRSPSPARNPASKIIHIRNLVRPFTVNQLKELLKRNGNLNEELFWIDKIKSHCFAVYDTEDEAIETRKALHNTTWPLSNPKTLIVDFGSEEQMDYYRGDEKPIPAPDKKEKASLREQKQKEKEEKQRLIQEERQKEIERRQKEREQRMKERLEREEHDRPKPIREWDKDKKSREDWDRTLQKSRSRSPRDRRGHRSRSGSPARERRRERSRERSRDRTGRREKKKGPEKKEDEPPAKLLDDLFKKTKTTPCIYWLPLTEAQIADREKFRNARPILRQKQEGDRVSPMKEIPEDARPVARRRQTNSPVASRKISQEGIGDRPRGRRSTPERRRRESSPNPRSRSGGKRR